MPTLTKNLFWGQGQRDHQLNVIEGHWPDDMEGSVFVIGPDKQHPDGHWFNQHGLLQKISMRPGSDGRIDVRHRRVKTPLERIRRRLPKLFKTVDFMELSPLGVSNLANTNVQPIGDRLFIGYDAGRPIEVDPETMKYVTAVGANDEWLQGAPGLLEPLCAVAAHPGPDFEESALYFVNYSLLAPPGVSAETNLARWSLDGPIEKWRVEGMSPFDSIHDIKVTRNHLVFCDLPYMVEPGSFRGDARQNRNQDHTKLWIVAKEQLRNTAPGGTVHATEVQIPMPTGHLLVDYDEQDGNIRATLQQIPLTDLMVTVGRESLDHRNGELIDPNYEGLIALALQPSVVGRYDIDPATGEVLDSQLAIDEERAWGGILATTDTHRVESRKRTRRMWYAGLGFDPDLVPQAWWDLYGEATDGLVAPADLPTKPVAGSLSMIDIDSMKVSEVFSYENGSFPSPPTFVPRAGASDPDDGYIVVVVHQDGPKEVQVFDAHHIEDGPLARASTPTFNPGLLLHSCWMADRIGPRPSTYKVGVWRDVKGAVRGMPGVMKSIAKMGAAMGKEEKAKKKASA